MTDWRKSDRSTTQGGNCVEVRVWEHESDQSA